uniref:DUF2383 domain-containing protein n=1 Tax=Strongyloides venezuelensis TaxID=75913 RepID=A0A0K0F6N7_STRVS
MSEINMNRKKELKNITKVAEMIIDNYNHSENIFEKEDVMKNMYNIDKNTVKNALEDFDDIVRIIEDNLNTSKVIQTNEEIIVADMNKRSFIQMMSELHTIIISDNKELHNIYDKFCQDMDETRQNILILEKQLKYMK